MSELLQAQARLDQKRQSLKILTKSTTPLDSKAGQELLQKKICKKHGEYDSELRVFGPIKNWAPCPNCQAEYEAQELEAETIRQKHRMSGLHLASNIPARYRDATLKNCQAITAKHSAAIDELQFSGADVHSMLLLGKPGTGKTYAVCAIVRAFITATGKSAEYHSANEILRKVKATYNRNSEQTEDEIFNHFGGLGLLAIDDIGVQHGTDTEKNIIHEIVNKRYESVLPTILTSNLAITEVAALIGERVIDRMKDDGGKVIVFDWCSYRGRGL